MTRCGIVAIIGRPNVGKSTLINQIVGTKVSITSSTPNTTRNLVRGIVTDGNCQIIFVDTPGLHRARTNLGGRLNEAARTATDGVDVIVTLIDAGAEIGPGDRTAITAMFDARRGSSPKMVVAANKMDRKGRDQVADQLIAATQAVEEIGRQKGFDDPISLTEFFPLSAKNGTNVDALTDYLRRVMPEGPFLFPDDEVSDVPEATWIAELVREQLVRKTHQELPHSIHCRVVEFEWPHVLVEILVERESQKGMVIGKGGQLLKDVGIAARRQLPDGCFLELRVSVEPSWQTREDMLDRFGY